MFETLYLIIYSSKFSPEGSGECMSGDSALLLQHPITTVSDKPQEGAKVSCGAKGPKETFS